MRLEEFVTTFHNRSPNMMFLLGAGASASSGIPTAGDMIWDFKRTLYCAANRISIRSISDLANASIRAKIQQYFDSTGQYPPLGAAEEYEAYFEALHRTEADRRKYIDRMTSSAVPSYGNLALAALLAEVRGRMIWTTNFDRVIEDSCVSVFKTSSRLVVSTLDTPSLAQEAMNEERWPVLVKLHGDLQSRRLKNTSPELQSQDSQLRETLSKACQRFGLVVLGYSGRDNSVMEALETALVSRESFPQGLFWIHRSASRVSERVLAFIQKARDMGIDAHLVPAETFDEVIGDLINLLPKLPTSLADLLMKHAPRLTNAPQRPTQGRYPLLRLNALPLLECPKTCRRVVCKIGGYREIREAVKRAGVDVVVGRRSSGIVAFGPDTEIRKAFADFGISEFDLHSIESHKLQHNSAELGLVYEAFCKALARSLPVGVHKRRGDYHLVLSREKLNEQQVKGLKGLGSLFGQIPRSDVQWTQAFRMKLEYRDGRLWLLGEPTFWAFTSKSTPKEQIDSISDYFREKGVPRYNSQWNAALDSWLEFIFSGSSDGSFSAFGTQDGVDASFKLGRRTAYSLRGGVQ